MSGTSIDTPTDVAMASVPERSQENNDDSLVWGGSLYYNPRKKRPHKSCKYWCEFHREVSHIPRELRFYHSRANGVQSRQNAVGTIPLQCDIIEVVSGVNYGHSTSFKIITRETGYIIGTDVPEQAESWTYAIWKELFGPVTDGIIYNYNVEVEQNRTAQEYDIMGSYLLKIFDEEVRLFSANGKISTKFRKPIKDIVKASSIDLANKPRHVISLAVLNIDSGENGGDVMVFQASCAHDIARVINHRKNVLFKSSSSRDLPKQPSVIDLPQPDEDVVLPNKVNKTLSPPQTPHITTTTKKFRTNPENHLYANFNAVVQHRAAQQVNVKSKSKVSKSTRKTKLPLLSSKPKQDQPRKSSEPSVAVNGTKNFLSRGNRKKSEPIFAVSGCRLAEVEDSNVTPSNIDRLIPFNTADKRLSVSARPPAPLPRSLASLDTDKLLPISPNSIAMSPSKSDSQILNYQQNGGSPGHDSTKWNSSDFLSSPLQLSLDHVYSDPHFEMDPDNSCVWEKDEHLVSSDGESNYSDSELWLCKKQKRLSQRSKKLSQKRKSGGNSADEKSLCANSSSDVPEMLNPRKENGCQKNNHQMYNGKTSPLQINRTQDISPPDHTYSVIGRLHNDPLPQLPSVYDLPQSHKMFSNHAMLHCNSDSELLECDSDHKKKASTKSISSIATSLHHDDDNCSDGEIWLSRQQAMFSRRSKKISQTKKLLTSQTNAKTAQDQKISISTDNVSAYKSSELYNASCQEQHTSQGNHISRFMKEQSLVHKYFMIRRKEGVPLPIHSPRHALHNGVNKRRSKSLEDSSFMVASDRSSVYTDLQFDMEDIATWREYKGASSVVCDAEPNYSDSELYKDQKLSRQQRLLTGKNKTSTRNFNIGTSPTDLAPLKVDKQLGSLSVLSDTTQHSESLFPLSPDPECYYTNDECNMDPEPYTVVDSPPHKYWRIARNKQPLPHSPILLETRRHHILSTCNSSEDGDQVYSVPRTSNLLARCNSVDDCYYSDSESWLRGNQRTLSSADNEINQTLNKGSDYDSEKETRNPNMHSVKKKPQVLPRLHKPVAAPRKNVSANVTPLHNDTRALTEKNTASAKLLTDNGNCKKSSGCSNDQSVSLPMYNNPSTQHNDQLLMSATEHRTSCDSSSRFSASFLVRCNTGSSQGSRKSAGDAVYLELISSTDYTYSYCDLKALQCEIDAAADSDLDSCDQWLAHVRQHFDKDNSNSRKKSFHHYQNVPDVCKYVHSGQEFVYQDQGNVYDLLPSSVAQSPGNDLHSKINQVTENIKRLNSQDFTNSM